MSEKDFYKTRIVEMVQEMDNLRYLEFLYELLISFKKKWGI